MDTIDRFRGCLLGLAAGDAVGTAVEFKPRGSFAPLTGLTGGGPFNLLPGQWTDDTSMALCLAVSLIEKNGFDPLDQMQRYCRWADQGYLSSNGRCFDIGVTIASALRRFKADGEPYAGSSDPHTAGNGSIMRLAAIPMLYQPALDLVENYAADSSRTTHGAAECVDACRLLGRILCLALSGRAKEEVVFADSGQFAGAEKIVDIANGAYRHKRASHIRGTGYVVDSLEAALWCFLNSTNFENAILLAANLGDDADTTAAVCGQVAGAFYGIDNIPSEWLDHLALKSEITALADRLWQRSNEAKTT